jgi:hypothetical protein
VIYRINCYLKDSDITGAKLTDLNGVDNHSHLHLNTPTGENYVRMHL